MSKFRNIIFYHAGGCKILDAFIIAEMWTNVYLETSFSLSYWKKSSIENDLNFVIKMQVVIGNIWLRSLYRD